MKKLLTVALFLLAFCAFGQTSVYHPFPINNANWFYILLDSWHNPTSTIEHYVLSGDTIISNVNYKKLFYSSIYTGALREDNRTVFFFPDTATHDYVLYDFNLTAGDTIFYPFGGTWNGSDTVIIMQEDSVLATDGYHRRIWIDYNNIYIEGIGSISTLLSPASAGVFGSYSDLICFSGDSYVYPSSMSACITSLPTAKDFSNRIKVFPNPSTGSFIVEIDQAINLKEILISDLLGNIIFQRQATDEKTITINNINGGAYILTVLDTDNHMTKKIIISCP